MTEVVGALLKAKEAFPEWSKLSINERIEHMKKFSEILEKEKGIPQENMLQVVNRLKVIQWNVYFAR